MRTLFLLRHAQAARGLDDKHRPLTAQGLADARELGRVMLARKYKPDLILCSPALRTRQTLQGLLETLGDIETQFPENAYYTSIGQLYELLKQTNEKAPNLMLVSHNPSIHGLANFLSGLGPPEFIHRIQTQYREGTLCVLQCPLDSWAALVPGENDLADLRVPGWNFTAHPDPQA